MRQSDELEERLAEQPRPERAFSYKFSRFRLDARIFGRHSFFTLEDRVHVNISKVRKLFGVPANRPIEHGSRSEPQHPSSEARMKRKTRAAEHEDTSHTTDDQDNFALSKEDETENKCDNEAPTALPIFAPIEASPC